jgi:hypothetical protein
MGRAANRVGIVAIQATTRLPMANTFDTRKSCFSFDQSSTLVAVIELSKDSWLAGGIVPGLERSPAKKLNTNEKREEELLALLLRWRDEAIK